MEIIEKIHLTFDDLNQERLVSVATTCLEMVTSLRLNLAFCKKDQHKLKIIHSKQKEAKEKIKEMATKAQYAVNLYFQHLDIEYNKAFNYQPFNLPESPDDTSIFNVELFRPPDSEDQYNGMDHLECALTNAQKVCQESIVWTIFYSELGDMELEVKEEISIDKPKKLCENTSFVKVSSEGIINGKEDKTGLSTNESFLPSKVLQIFNKGAYDLFCYLQTEYSMDDHSPVAKYSYIYRFLAHEQLVTARSQSKYMDWIKVTMGIPMSKVFCKTYKYDDTIHNLLCRLKSNFERRNKLEMI